MAKIHLNSRFFILSALLVCFFGCAKNPETAETQINQGDQSFEANDYDKAVKDYTAAIAVKPEAKVYEKRARAFAAKGEHEQAIKDYYEVLDRDQDSAESWTGLGISSLETKEYAVAASAFQKALRLDPKYAPAYYWRAMLSKAQGEKDNAVADFKKFLEISNDAKLKEAAQAALKELGAK